MYCKNCGQQIADDSRFCKDCGAKQEETNIKEQRNEESSCSPFVIIIIFLFVAIALVSSIITLEYMNTGNDKINNFFDSITAERKATNKDIVTEFESITQYSKADEYKMRLQANEKIKNLVLEIDFLDKNGNVLKTETIKVGNVTPGNEYNIKLSQGGMSPSDIDKTKRFKIRVINGYVVK